MKGKSTFNAYCDWQETFEALTDEQAGQLAKHLFRYVNDQDPEPPNPLIKAVFASIKATLKRDLSKWVKVVERNRANGSKGGRPKQTQYNPNKPTGLNGNPKNPNKPDRDRDRDRDKDRDKEVIIKRGGTKKFVPPTLQEVDDYVCLKNYQIDPERFISYYESNGWMVGRNKMKDWKAAVRNWASRSKEKSSAKKEISGGKEFFRQRAEAAIIQMKMDQ